MYLIIIQDEIPNLLNGPWEIIDKIGNPIALIAFIVAIVAGYFQYKIVQERKLLEKMPEDSKFNAAQLYLERQHIPIEDLSQEQRFELAMKTIENKGKHQRNLIILTIFISGTLGILAYTANKKAVSKEVPMLQYAINYKIPSSKDSILTRKVIDTKEFRNGHCASDTNINWDVKSDFNQGWKIIIDSIKILNVSTRSKDRFNGISNKSSDGFTLSGVVRNKGKCTPFSRDARGKLVVTYSYLEEKNTMVAAFDNIILKGNTVEGNELSVDVPKNALDYSVELIDSKNNKTRLSKNNPSAGIFTMIQEGENLIIKN